MKYTNPVIKGFHPDPSVCRSGNEFYLVTSTFEYFPGIALFRSTDLINWEQIGYCITRPSQLSFDKFQNSGGIWAPTIRCNNGRFYVTATVDGMGNMIIHTDDINGEWSDPVWVDMDGIDPSITFDNGKCYYYTNARGKDNREAISAAKINPDTGELLTAPKQVWYGIGEGWLEGPHIYHIGDWYYMLTSEGGTSYNHMISVGRSRTIMGEYEPYPHNPILTNRNDTSKQAQCSGHGDIVRDNDGNWHMIHLATRCCLGTRTMLGRETFLSPVKFEDEWITVPARKALLENECGDIVQRETEFFCDFESDTWEPQWQFIRTPNETTFVRGGGKLEIKPSPLDFTAPNKPSFVGMVQPDFEFETSVSLGFSPCNTGDEAGIMLYLQSDTYYRLALIKKADGVYITVKRRCDDMAVTDFEQKTDAASITLTVKGDKEKYHFYADGVHLCSVSVRFICTQTASRCFTGTMAGLYSACETQSETKPVFKNFILI